MNKVIRATDDNALEALKERLAQQQAAHEEMKKQNEYFRKNCTMVGYSDMKEETAKLFDEKIAKRYSWERQPHPAWKLQNSNQEIRRTKQRIKQLEAEQSRGETTYNTEGLGFEVVENKELKRLQVIYPDRVDKATYQSLRYNGFVFSKTNQAFQRQLNESARWSVRHFIEEQRRALQAKPVAEM